eukprot:1997052-Amphidinium_carterae.2
MHEAEVLTARERDGYFEQLLAAVPQIPSAPAQEAHPLPVAGTHPMPATSASGTQSAVTWQVPEQAQMPEFTTGMAAASAATPAVQDRNFLERYLGDPLGQVAHGFNPLTGLYGTDPPMPATAFMQAPSVVTPPGLTSHYSIATPPFPQGAVGGNARLANPLADPLHTQGAWGDYLSTRMSTGHLTSAKSVGTQSSPRFSHVSTPQGCAFGSSRCAATPAAGTPCFSQAGGTQPTPGNPRVVFHRPEHLGTQAVTIWQSAVAHAQAQHAHCFSLTPAQRALKTSGMHQGFHITPPLVLAEAHIKSELLTGKILPDKFVVYIAATKAGTLAKILEVLFQKYLPSEPTAQEDALTLIETPLKTAKSFTEALRTLRVWKEQLIITIQTLHGRLDTLRLY